MNLYLTFILLVWAQIYSHLINEDNLHLIITFMPSKDFQITLLESALIFIFTVSAHPPNLPSSGKSDSQAWQQLLLINRLNSKQQKARPCEIRPPPRAPSSHHILGERQTMGITRIPSARWLQRMKSAMKRKQATSGRAALQRCLSGDLPRLETRTHANKGIDGLPALFQREFQAINSDLVLFS